MKLVFKKIYLLIKDVLGIFEYVWNMFIIYCVFRFKTHESFSPFPLKQNARKGRTISVLANGPSLRSDLDRMLVDAEFENVDFSVMNFFANDPIFTEIKPKYYCLWDPMFYQKDDRYDMVMELFANMDQKTHWNMTLFIKGSIDHFRSYSQINNPQIYIVSISAPRINTRRNLKNFFYRHGWALPYTWTVANVNMFTAIQLGYENVRLYGADMTLFDGLCVNSNNELCRIVSHFYENENENELKPVYHHDLGKPQRLAEYIEQVLHMIEGHDDIAEYAKSLGVKCLNCCKNSMLDCYPRKKFD